MKNTLTTYTLALVLIFVANAQNLLGQGCVAVRQMGGTMMCSANSNMYNLSKGDFQIGSNYRYFHSWRHFVGTEEQPQRQITGGGHDANGKELGNAVNIYSHSLDFNVSYGLSNRFQLNATLPFAHNERSQVLRTKVDTFRYSVYAKGMADARLSLNYWVFDPHKVNNGNLMLGLGIKLNNGLYNATDDAPQSDGTVAKAVMDQAIQPGDGGIGFSVELQAFRHLSKGLYGFASGYYLFNPRENNGVFKSKPSEGLEGYNLYASPDQYLMRAGLMGSIGHQNSLNVSLAGRMEGIPAYDALGGQVAYRRPGYVIAVEPGISYRMGKHNISLFVPYNVVKNRIQSAADIAKQDLQNAKITDLAQKVHVQGDAAFADYSINIGYTYRIARARKEEE